MNSNLLTCICICPAEYIGYSETRFANAADAIRILRPSADG